VSPLHPYRGRFAPSPTGPLHFGSLIAAVGSYLRARSRGGEWLVRIEDLDPPREVRGAADDILRTLERFGFQWDGAVVYQSRRHAAYQAALEQLLAQGAAYPCACSRREIQAGATAGPAGPVYPGTCRRGLHGRKARAVRVNTDGSQIAFDDALQGAVVTQLEKDIGDFVIRRADGLYAYHLALVVDDAAARISEVVRGVDLLACTAPQIHLQRLLGLPEPAYLHLPVALNALGQKLSKQTGAPPLNARAPARELTAALRFLGQNPPGELARASVARVWEWADLNWQAAAIAPQSAPAPAAH
jgi:glutamyl-Q tRNA(Asp) synthetase